MAYGSWKNGYGELVREGATPARLQSLVGQASRTLLWQAAALAVLVGVADAA